MLGENKKQAADWEKIFAKRIFDKGIVSKIFKELFKFNNRNQATQLDNEWGMWTDTSPKKVYRWQINIHVICPQENVNTTHAYYSG